MSLILPGENPENIIIHDGDLAFGPNIYQSPIDHPRALTAGILDSKTKHNKSKGSTTIAYVDTNIKRYVPALRDHVIGVIIGKASNGYRVLLQDNSPPVFLDAFAFENATKKNRPNLSTGTLIYARVSLDDPDIEANIECFDSASGKSAGFGELKGGYVVNVSLGYARELLKGQHAILSAIGEKTPYEVAIGVNGKIWIDAPDTLTIWRVAEAITKGQFIAPSQVDGLIRKIFNISNK